MDVNQLKENGNTLIRDGKFVEAIECYTAGLEIDHSNHALLSNRSLGFLRLGRFEEALKDAEKCNKVAPSFARGYLRRSVALNNLGRYADAMSYAEKGYKLRQSDTICKECVSQWLVANQSVHQSVIHRFQTLTPPGCLILSEKIGEIILHINALRRSAAGMTAKSMQDYLVAVTSELEQLLSKFGHQCSTCFQEWIDSLPSSGLLDPENDCIPSSVKESIIQKGTNLSEWILSDVDQILYPLTSPVICLYSVIISNRAYCLSSMNTGHHEREVICKSVLPLHTKGPLGDDAYIASFVGILLGLVGSFINRRNGLTSNDRKELADLCQETKVLLEKLPVGLVDLKNLGLRGLVKADECLKTTDKSFFLTGSISLGAKEVFGMINPLEVVPLVSRQMDQLEAKPPLLLTLEDSQHMLRASSFLMDMGHSELAAKAFHTAERLYYKIFGQKMSLGLWSVDEMGSIIAQPRSMVIEVAAKLAATDMELFTDAIIRWKCLQTEFVALLMSVGMGSIYQSTYKEVFEAQKEVDKNTLLQVASEHRKRENILAQLHGPTALTILFTQSHDLVQRVLEKDEIVLDYCHLGAYIEKGVPAGARGAVVMIKPEGKPMTYTFSFDEVFDLNNQWLPLLSAAGDSLTETPPEANCLSQKICHLLFPSLVREAIESDQVKRVFLCVEVGIAEIPFDLLIFPDNQLLFQKCAVTLISSSREIIRYDGVRYLKRIIDQSSISSTLQSSTGREQVSAEKGAASIPLTNPKVEPNSPPGASVKVNSAEYLSRKVKEENISELKPDEKSSKTSECVIFANPNFDLAIEDPQGIVTKVTDAMKSIFGQLFRSSLAIGPAESLPATEEEASNIERIMPNEKFSSIKKFTGDSATIRAALEVQTPQILHFATHAFSCVKPGDYRHQPFGINFWASTTSCLLLAGANTCSSGNYDKISSEAGSGQLPSLAICGMNLENTSLVYLSVCSSSAGHTMAGESSISLSQAFRVAGAHSVIATRWPVDDTASKTFSSYFYSALCNRDPPLGSVHPSEALVSAKEAMRQHPDYKHWFYWASFLCVGYDFPPFPC